MKLKTLKVHGGVKSYRDRDGHIWPEGTQRDILEYCFLPRTIAGETRRGLQIIRERATVRTFYDVLDPVGCDYNGWKDVRFLDTTQIQ